MMKPFCRQKDGRIRSVPGSSNGFLTAKFRWPIQSGLLFCRYFLDS